MKAAPTTAVQMEIIHVKSALMKDHKILAQVGVTPALCAAR